MGTCSHNQRGHNRKSGSVSAVFDLIMDEEKAVEDYECFLPKPKPPKSPFLDGTVKVAGQKAEGTLVGLWVGQISVEREHLT